MARTQALTSLQLLHYRHDVEFKGMNQATSAGKRESPRDAAWRRSGTRADFFEHTFESHYSGLLRTLYR